MRRSMPGRRVDGRTRALSTAAQNRPLWIPSRLIIVDLDLDLDLAGRAFVPDIFDETSIASLALRRHIGHAMSGNATLLPDLQLLR